MSKNYEYNIRMKLKCPVCKDLSIHNQYYHSHIKVRNKDIKGILNSFNYQCDCGYIGMKKVFINKTERYYKMDKEKVLEILKMLFEVKDKDLFIAQMLYEKCDRVADIIDLQDADFDYAEKIYYECYLEHDGEDSKWNESIFQAINNEFDFEEEEEEEEEE
jgi:hypothetical protein